MYIKKNHQNLQKEKNNESKQLKSMRQQRLPSPPAALHCLAHHERRWLLTNATVGVAVM